MNAPLPYTSERRRFKVDGQDVELLVDWRLLSVILGRNAMGSKHGKSSAVLGAIKAKVKKS